MTTTLNARSFCILCLFTFLASSLASLAQAKLPSASNHSNESKPQSSPQIQNYRLQLAGLTVDRDRAHWINVRLKLGIALRKMGVLQRNLALIEESVALFAETSEALSPKQDLSDWGRAQANMAEGMVEAGKLQSNPQRLQEAIQVIQSFWREVKAAGLQQPNPWIKHRISSIRQDIRMMQSKSAKTRH